MALVTPEQVSTVTGATVDPGLVNQAQTVVDIHAGVELVDPDALTPHDATADALSSVDKEDLRLLKYAVAYQAAWLATQIDFTSRTDVSDLGNTAVQFRDEHALILAPLASRSLARLSWKRPRTLRDRTRSRAQYGCHPAPDGVTVSHDPRDNPNQTANFLRDAGPFRELPA